MTQTHGNVLIIDDDFSLRHALKSTLSHLGFQTSDAPDGERGLALLKDADAVLLDMNMPGMGGVKACMEIRRRAPSVGILMLTVRDMQEDVVRALDAGADDYITKPFHSGELAARLRATIRRGRAIESQPAGAVAIGELELDRGKRLVTKRGVPIRLTPKEFELLEQLMMSAGMPLTHAKLLRSVWGPEYGGELEYLRTFIRQLRVKIEDDPSNPRYILTNAFVGYRFCEPKRL